MRVVIQRVTRASVTNDTSEKRSIQFGLLILLGIETNDGPDDIDFLTGKLARLRIFDDQQGIMNLSVIDVKGELLILSQFTLLAETRKGNRPSYIKAARPETAIPLYENFVRSLKSNTGLTVQQGWFGAHMQVELVNDGPVTIIIDSKNR